MKESKQSYYNKYFERNWNNINSLWRGMKYLISLRTVASSVPTAHYLVNDDTITNLFDIANNFNNYFASIVETVKNVRCSQIYLSEYLTNVSDSIIFLKPKKKVKIANIMSSPNFNKVYGPNSIPCRVSFLLKNDRFIQPLFYDWCFSIGTRNCKTSSCF